MLKWILGIAAGLVWCVLIFIATWWFTFPSEAVVDRVAFEVQKASNGSYALKAGSASPWWAGLTMQDVMLLSVDEPGGAGTPVFRADSVSARTNLLSLVTGGLPVHAVVEIGESPVVIDAQLDRSANPPKLQKLDAEAPALSISDIGAMLRPLGADIKGDGSLQVIVDAELADKVDDHDGRLKVTGKDLTLTLVVPDPISGGDFEIKDMEVSEIDLVLDVKDGNARLKRGTIVSDRAQFDIDLDVTLNKNFDRSRLRGTMVMSNLGGELKSFEAAFLRAKWDDGKYHYRIQCTVKTLSASCIKPQSQPRSSARSAPSADEIRNRIQQNREREPASATDRSAAVNPNRRRPGEPVDDRDRDDEEEDEGDEDEETDEPEEEGNEDANAVEVQNVEIDAIAPPGLPIEMPGPNDLLRPN